MQLLLLTVIVFATVGLETAAKPIDVTNGNELIDMSHVFDENTMYFNGKRYFNFTEFLVVSTDKMWAQVNQFHSVEHGGTHGDSPNHFIKGARSWSDIPISQFIGKAVIIDSTEKVKKNSDYVVTVDDLKNWEKEHGRIPKGAIIFLQSNWETRWPDPMKVFDRKTPLDSGPGLSGGSHHPSLSSDAADWLVKQRPDIHAVGVDTPSIDAADSESFPAHMILLRHNLYILENVANLSRVPNFATIYAMPMKIGMNSTGGPVRLIASISSADKLCATFFKLIVIFSLGLYVYKQ